MMKGQQLVRCWLVYDLAQSLGLLQMTWIRAWQNCFFFLALLGVGHGVFYSLLVWMDVSGKLNDKAAPPHRVLDPYVVL